MGKRTMMPSAAQQLSEYAADCTEVQRRLKREYLARQEAKAAKRAATLRRVRKGSGS